ncbi:hypothetical protein FRC10_004115 [Ceratobasidium sp. 414]|nr:hypothetical protein FRC10_004115 [Ceratobasidium sp. 414]
MAQTIYACYVDGTKLSRRRTGKLRWDVFPRDRQEFEFARWISAQGLPLTIIFKDAGPSAPSSAEHARPSEDQMSLDIEFKTRPKYPINLKLLSSGIKQYVTQAVGRDQALRLENLNPIDADTTGWLEIRVYELHWFGKKQERMGSVSFQVSEMANAQDSITVHDTSANVPFSVTVALDPIGDNYHPAQMAHEAASKAIAASPNVLENMRRTREAVDTIIKVAQDLGEILNEQGQCGDLVANLVTEMGDVLSHVAAVENHAKIASLRDTVKELLLLVEDASRFVAEYKSDGAAVRAVRAFGGSNAQAQVDEFVARFGRLKEKFDRGMTAQVVRRVEQLLDDSDRALLKELIVPGARYDPGRSCLEGTRVEMLEDIRNWTRATTGSPALFWLYGPAGCGKSSIAASMSELLHKDGTLAGSFFCKRDNERLRKSENVISHLAASIAFKCPAYGGRVVEALRRDPELAHSATKTRFAGLIVSPLEALGRETGFSTSIVVVDAIDESGTPESRAELVSCLLELSKLASWLKVLVTSRPNDEIRILRGSDQEPTKHRDLFQENVLTR